MLLRFFISVGIFFISKSAITQSPSYPKDYFRNPLDIPIQLAANFGEIRYSHWHMGLDMRTNQRENLPVYAAAAGYIAKVRIEPGGFGRVIFINHPNGLTTVYAHLNNFAPAFHEYVIGQQYKMESWQVELDFPPTQFPVQKGQLIAYSGNTGGSQGPHLHFEIRDTKTTRCLNPLLFGLPLADNVPPSIVRMAQYDRGRSVYEQTPKLLPVKKTANGYTTVAAIIKTGLRKTSFALQMFDKLSGSNNPVGVYGAELFVDGKPIINFFIDSVDYIETHAINAQVDYKYDYNGGPSVQHISQLPGDNCHIYHHINGDGVIMLNDTAVHSIRILVKDAYLNATALDFKLQYDESLAKSVTPHIPHSQLAPNVVNTIVKEDFEMNFPVTSLYDTIQPVYTRTESAGEDDAISPNHIFCDASIPPADYFTVKIKPTKSFPSIWGNKVVIKNNYGKRTSVRKADWQNEWLTARFNDFGSYQAFADTEPPAINAPGRGDTIDLSGAARLVLTPTDNFGIKSFRAELDGKWLMFTNDKGRNHIYKFDERCPYGVHSLKVTVTDLVGNTTVKEWWFKRYAYAPKKAKASKKPASKKKVVKKKK